MEDENEIITQHQSTQVTRQADYRLINIDDGFLNLMTVDSFPKDDVRVLEGQMGSETQESFEDGKNLIVTVRTASDNDTVVGFKIVKHDQ